MQIVNDLRELRRAVNQYGAIIVVKSNNNNNVKMMSMEEYDKMNAEDIEKNLLEAEDDIENGRVYDAEEVFKEWDEKYGV